MPVLVAGENLAVEIFDLVSSPVVEHASPSMKRMNRPQPVEERSLLVDRRCFMVCAHVGVLAVRGDIAARTAAAAGCRAALFQASVNPADYKERGSGDDQERNDGLSVRHLHL